jgi:spermidine synthase
MIKKIQNLGSHLIIEFYECNEELINNAQEVEEALTEDVIIITQSESFMYQKDIIKNIATFSKKIFPHYFYYYTMVPTYPNGLIGFSFCSKKYNPITDVNQKKAAALKDLKYYSYPIHKASFVLPQTISTFIENIKN